MNHRARLAWTAGLVAGASALGSTWGCSTLLGIGSLDAGAADAQPDATTAPEVAAEAAVETAGAPDSCAPVSPEGAVATDAEACPAPDAGGCTLAQVTPSMVAWVPPSRPERACTAAEVTSYYEDCLGPQGTRTACDTFESTDPACTRCLIGSTSEKTYGAAVSYASGLTFINVGGCIATIDPCNLPCAQAVFAGLACEDGVCAACPLSGSATAAACVDQASTCPCAQYTEALRRCEADLTEAGSPAVPCFAGDYASIFTYAGTALCVSP